MIYACNISEHYGHKFPLAQQQSSGELEREIGEGGEVENIDYIYRAIICNSCTDPHISNRNHDCMNGAVCFLFLSFFFKELDNTGGVITKSRNLASSFNYCRLYCFPPRLINADQSQLETEW